jgi:hypothetical protein
VSSCALHQSRLSWPSSTTSRAACSSLKVLPQIPTSPITLYSMTASGPGPFNPTTRFSPPLATAASGASEHRSASSQEPPHGPLRSLYSLTTAFCINFSIPAGSSKNNAPPPFLRPNDLLRPRHLYPLSSRLSHLNPSSLSSSTSHSPLPPQQPTSPLTRIMKTTTTKSPFNRLSSFRPSSHVRS